MGVSPGHGRATSANRNSAIYNHIRKPAYALRPTVHGNGHVPLLRVPRRFSSATIRKASGLRRVLMYYCLPDSPLPAAILVRYHPQGFRPSPRSYVLLPARFFASRGDFRPLPAARLPLFAAFLMYYYLPDSSRLAAILARYHPHGFRALPHSHLLLPARFSASRGDSHSLPSASLPLLAMFYVGQAVSLRRVVNPPVRMCTLPPGALHPLAHSASA